MAGDVQVRRGAWVWRLAKRLLPLLIVLAAAGGVAAVAIFMPRRPREAPPTQARPVNVQVEVVRAEMDLPDSFELVGTVEPYRVVRLAAEVAGRVERYADHQPVPAGMPVQVLREGDRIDANVPILYLNTDLLQADYDQAKAKLAFDQKEYRRYLEAVERGVATPKEVDAALTSLAVSQAAFQAAQARLDRAVVYAPVGGVLNKLPAEVGEYVKVGDPVAEIVQQDQVKAVANVPERDIHYLAIGQTHAVSDKLLDRPPRAAQITYIDALADPQARTTRVELTVDNRDGQFHSGRIVSVRLTRRVFPRAITIPLEAVMPQEGEPLEETGRAAPRYEVYVVQDGQAVRQPVELGILWGTRVVVTSGLKEGERLIYDGQRLCAPGQPVRVIDVRDAAVPAGAASKPAGGPAAAGPLTTSGKETTGDAPHSQEPPR